MSKARYRSFIYTLNNPAENGGTPELIGLLKTMCSYIIIGEEVAPTTGTIHWQGFCELNNQVTISKINKMAKWHTEARKGSAAACDKYCRKDGKIICEYGKLPCPGKRTDIETLKAVGAP